MFFDKLLSLLTKILNSSSPNMSRVMINLLYAFAKAKAQISCDRAADKRLCFHYIDSIYNPLHPISEISTLWQSSVTVQPGLCRTLTETPKTGFLAARHILYRCEQYQHLNE